jgi:hypothetical protein
MNHRTFIVKLSILIFGYYLLMGSITAVLNMALLKVPFNALWYLLIPIFWTAIGIYWLNRIVKFDSEMIINSLGKDQSLVFESSFEEIIMAHKTLSKEMGGISESINRANSELKRAEAQTNILNQTISELEQKIDALNININQNEALFMTSGRRLPLDVYLTDSNGRIIKSNKKMDVLLDASDCIGDVLAVSSSKLEMFKKKDFDKIMIGLKTG